MADDPPATVEEGRYKTFNPGGRTVIYDSSDPDGWLSSTVTVSDLFDGSDQ